MSDFPKLMGMAEATAYLGVTRQYLDYLVETGRLRCQKLKTGKIFLMTDIEALQRVRKQKGLTKKRR